MQIERVVIIGSGNVAEALARAMAKSGVGVVQVFARNAVRGAEVAAIAGAEYASDPSQLAAADLYVVAVSDRAVAEAVAPLHIPEDAVVAHTAGSVEITALPATVRHRAALYPMQTFTRGRGVDFADIPIFLETECEEDYALLEAFARKLSGNVCRADSERRRRIHLAAVFACNFSNAMYTIGEEIIRQAGLDFSALKPLVRETAAKALDAESPCTVQTGPAVRNDFVTKGMHVEMLADNPLLKSLYSTISQSIWETSRKI